MAEIRSPTDAPDLTIDEVPLEPGFAAALGEDRPRELEALVAGAWLPPREPSAEAIARALLEAAAALVRHDGAALDGPNASGGWVRWGARGTLPLDARAADTLTSVVRRAGRTLLATARGSGASAVAVPLFDGLGVRAVAHFQRAGGRAFDPADARLLALLSAQTQPWFAAADAFERVHRQSRTDALTGLGNRRDLDESLHRLGSLHQRSGRPLALLMVDLDGFKAYNDRHGHERGDRALKDFTRLLRGLLREGDIACRYGGDEFAVLLPDTDEAGALRLAERIREAVAPRVPIPVEDRLSVSIGVAALGTDEADAERLLERADHALFAAKQSGRNAVAGAPSPAHVEVGGATGADNVAHHILRAAMEAVGARRGSLVWRSGDRFYLHTAAGFAAKPMPAGVEVEPHVGVLGELFKEGKPLVVEDIRGLGLTQETGRGYTHPSFLAIPLYWSGRPVGALCLANKAEERTFSTDDLALILPLVKTLMDCLGGRVRGDEERTLH